MGLHAGTQGERRKEEKDEGLPGALASSHLGDAARWPKDETGDACLRKGDGWT